MIIDVRDVAKAFARFWHTRIEKAEAEGRFMFTCTARMTKARNLVDKLETEEYVS